MALKATHPLTLLEVHLPEAITQYPSKERPHWSLEQSHMTYLWVFWEERTSREGGEVVYGCVCVLEWCPVAEALGCRY